MNSFSLESGEERNTGSLRQLSPRLTLESTSSSCTYLGLSMQSADLLADSACNTRQPSEKNHPKCNKIYFQRVFGCFFPLVKMFSSSLGHNFQTTPKMPKSLEKFNEKYFPQVFGYMNTNLHEYIFVPVGHFSF